MSTIRNTGVSLSLLRNEEATLRQAGFTAWVQLHEASIFNKDVRQEYQLFPHKLYPNKRKFVDSNSIRMKLLGASIQFHFTACLNEYQTSDL